jgi:hypothetical protein
MRIPRAWLPSMAKRIVETLFAEELIVPDIEPTKLQEKVEEIITEELSVEDRVNDEVREILKKFETEFASGRADYRKMFDLTKRQLVKEREIII